MPTKDFQPIDKGTDGLQRKLLPQIPKNKVGKFVRLLLGYGIDVTARKVVASELKPVQKNVNKEKIKEMQPQLYELVKKPFIVSKENYIMDGHHTWVLAKENNKDFPLTALVVDLPIKELIRVGRIFEGSHSKGINESLLKEGGVWPEDMKNKFAEAKKILSKQIREVAEKQRDIEKLQKEWPKIEKLLNDWAWGRGQAKKMTQQQFDKIIIPYTERLQAVGVIEDYEYLTM